MRGQTFGGTLRAYRLGYRESERLQAFVRMQDNPDGTTVNVTLVPAALTIPNGRGRGTHRCWWECPQGKEYILGLIPALQKIKRVKKIISFDVDAETGERITS